MPPSTRRQTGELDAADFDADQLRDRVAECGHHAPDLAVAAFVDGQFDIRLSAGSIRVRLAAQEAHIFGGPGHAIIKHNPTAEPLQGIFSGNAGDRNTVGFRYVVARVSQLE